ncbi:histidine kinase [Amycolatopsis sp. NBC_01307]|uniref:sensor histidine kinase n=1 Tax=Amycolatopsis sp. NBC_01307 TaxID=2903561 RepID=UPI002E0E5FEE|nr:histidine kinase [Amycolatopsis sp. NBC_01307]
MVQPIPIRGTRLQGPAAEPPPAFEDERSETRTLVFAAQVAAAIGVASLASLPVLTGTQPGLVRLAAPVCAAVLAVGYLAGFGRGRVRRPVVVLLLQAVIGLMPFGASWSVAGGFFAGSVLLTFRPVLAVPGALLACAGAAVVPALPGGSVAAGLAGAVSAGVATLALFGLGTAARLVAERGEQVRELKRQAITEERKRFSSDLHDLLGMSLSAITLKGELVDRLVLGRPGQAKEELGELLVMSRRALADVRTIAAGYRDLSIEDECRAAAAVLSAAGTRVTVARSGLGGLPPQVATVLAMVLREGVTNVLRHSSASWCAFSVSTEDGTAWLEIVNDGAAGAACDGADSGAGLRNLRDRVQALDGALTTETGPDGTHRLLAAIPVRSGPQLARRRRAS